MTSLLFGWWMVVCSTLSSLPNSWPFDAAIMTLGNAYLIWVLHILNPNNPPPQWGVELSKANGSRIRAKLFRYISHTNLSIALHPSDLTNIFASANCCISVAFFFCPIFWVNSVHIFSAFMGWVKGKIKALFMSWRWRQGVGGTTSVSWVSEICVGAIWVILSRMTFLGREYSQDHPHTLYWEGQKSPKRDRHSMFCLTVGTSTWQHKGTSVDSLVHKSS